MDRQIDWPPASWIEFLTGEAFETLLAELAVEEPVASTDVGRTAAFTVVLDWFERKVTSEPAYFDRRFASADAFIAYCRRALIRQARRSGAHTPIRPIPPDEVPGGIDPARLAERQDLAERLAEAVEALDPADQELIIRHLVEGDSLAQLARERGVTRQTLHARLNRVLDALHNLLDAP